MLTEPVAKAAPFFAPSFMAALGHIGLEGPFILKIGAVAVGLVFGAMWRAGMLRSEGQSWQYVQQDLAVSALIGGGNAVLCLGIAEVFALGALLTMGLAVIVGATGLRALPVIRSVLLNAVQRWAIGNDVALIQPKAPELNKLVHKLDDVEERSDER